MAADSVARTRYWRKLDGGWVQCDVCPRHCKLAEGQRGACFVRACRGGEIVLTTYGGPAASAWTRSRRNHSTIFCPGHRSCLRHGRLQPDVSVLPELEYQSFAAHGDHRGRGLAGGDCRAAERLGCRSVAFTYNEPIVFLEYAVDTPASVRSGASRRWR